MTNSPEALLRHVNDRDSEISVLLQRIRLLTSSIEWHIIVDNREQHLSMQQGGMGSFGALKERLAVVCGCQEEVSKV